MSGLSRSGGREIRAEIERGPWQFAAGTQWTALSHAPRCIVFLEDDLPTLEQALATEADRGNRAAEAQGLLGRIRRLRDV